MALYSDEEIAHLIACPKSVSEAPAKNLKLYGADWRNSAKLVASDGTEGSFFVYIRRNDDLPENFSVGLVYHPSDGRLDVTLLRCNGKHGMFTGLGNATHPHWDYHIHKATEAAQNAGYTAEKYAATTSAFASYEMALQYFVKAVNLNPNEAAKFFPDRAQGSLFVN